MDPLVVETRDIDTRQKRSERIPHINNSVNAECWNIAFTGKCLVSKEVAVYYSFLFITLFWQGREN